MDLLNAVPPSGIRFLWIPCLDLACAERIGQEAVERHLAACANILPGMRSIYRWEGEIRHDVETVLLLKTTLARSQELTDLVVTLHPYEIPAVSRLPVDGGNAPFLDWVRQETTAVPDTTH